MPEILENTIFEKKSEAWNVAQGYTHLKILKPLVELDRLVKIAKYGTEDIDMSLNIPPHIKVQLRIEAMHRLVDLLREIIENSQFAMSNPSKVILENLENELEKVSSVISGIYKENYDQRTHETNTVINECHFFLCLEKLRSIKKDITKPLNDSSLIFPASDEIDLDKIKEGLVYSG